MKFTSLISIGKETLFWMLLLILALVVDHLSVWIRRLMSPIKLKILLIIIYKGLEMEGYFNNERMSLKRIFNLMVNGRYALGIL